MTTAPLFVQQLEETLHMVFFLFFSFFKLYYTLKTTSFVDLTYVFLLHEVNHK